MHIATGLLERNGTVLLVASRYPNLAEPVWNLPGGRQRAGELLAQTVRREFREEVSLDVEIGSLHFVAESYDVATGTHFLVCCFAVTTAGEPRVPPDDAHVVDAAWIPRGEIARVVTVPVVRDPLLAHLAGDPARYYGFADSGITIEFADPA